MPPAPAFCHSLLGAYCRGRVPRGWLGSPLIGAFAMPHRALTMDAQLALRHLLLKRRVRSHCRAGRVRERRGPEVPLGPLAATCASALDPGDALPPEAPPPRTS